MTLMAEPTTAPLRPLTSALTPGVAATRGLVRRALLNRARRLPLEAFQESPDVILAQVVGNSAMKGSDPDGLFLFDTGLCILGISDPSLELSRLYPAAAEEHARPWSDLPAATRRLLVTRVCARAEVVADSTTTYVEAVGS